MPPPPPWPSVPAMATRFANHWIADALAGDESLEFSVLQALLRASLEPLVGAPEATRERIALRSLQELSSLRAAGGDAAATAGVLRVDGALSSEDLLFRLTREAGSSGKLELNLLPPFSQDIQENIRTKKLTLPETSFQLLKGVHPWITSMTPQSQLGHSGTEHCDNDQSLCSCHKCVSTEKPVFPTDNAEVQQETMANLVNESETGNFQKDTSAATCVLHQPCTPESEDAMDAVGLGARSPERSPIVEGNMSVGSVLASAGCDAPLQGNITEPFSQQDKHDHTATDEPKSCRQKSPNRPQCADDGGSSNQSSKVSSHEGPNAHATVTPGFDRISDVLPTNAPEPGHLPECITAQDTTMISQPDNRKTHLSAPQHERGEKVNQDMEKGSPSIQPVEKDHAHGVLTLQSASVLLSISCNGANQGSKSETNLDPGTATEDGMTFEEQNADKSHLEVSDINKANQALHDDGSIMKNNMVHGGLTAQTAPVPQSCNVTLLDKTSEVNYFSEQKNEKNRTDVQDLCIKCGRDGQLLKCSGCPLAAHDSCFGSSVTFEGTDLFYCPVCCYKKATEAYKKAKKNVAAFLRTGQVSKQHDEQLNGVQPGATNRDGHSNGCGTSKRNSIHQNEAYNLAHRDEEPLQLRKKQKINARGNGYPEVLTEKVPFQNSVPASMNKHSVLQNNSKTGAEDPEKKQQAGDNEAHKEAGNDNSSHKSRASSRRKCGLPSNQDGEADQEDSLTASNQTGGSDEFEDTSSNDFGKRSSSPWRKNSKKRSHEKESAVPSKSREGIAQPVPTSPRKGSFVHPQQHCSNPVAPTGRRKRVNWTEDEEVYLREAMAKITPENDAQISWTQILRCGRGVFHTVRRPSDLKVKWRNMTRKTDSGNLK